MNEALTDESQCASGQDRRPDRVRDAPVEGGARFALIASQSI